MSDLKKKRQLAACAGRYLEQRSRLLPQLEKEHSHARVPHEKLEERLISHLAASSVTPLALLRWQLTARGSPFQLGELASLIAIMHFTECGLCTPIVWLPVHDQLEFKSSC